MTSRVWPFDSECVFGPHVHSQNPRGIRVFASCVLSEMIAEVFRIALHQQLRVEHLKLTSHWVFQNADLFCWLMSGSLGLWVCRTSHILHATCCQVSASLASCSASLMTPTRCAQQFATHPQRGVKLRVHEDGNACNNCVISTPPCSVCLRDFGIHW